MIPISALARHLEAKGLLASPVPDAPVGVTGISDDSRLVQPGDLYCAIRGHNEDGHRYLSDAARAGATAALVEAPEEGLELTQIEVTDSRRAAAIAAQVVFGNPTRDMMLVGVTGTNGKTTTALLARHVLSQEEPTAALGTLGAIAPAGDLSPTELTTPGPVAFARILADLKATGARRIVLEVSSHALTQHRVDGVEFDVAVFTNLSRDHLDYHTDFEDYSSAKSRLAGLVKRDGHLIVNADEPAWRALSSPARITRFGLEADAEYRAFDIRHTPRGSEWTLATPEGEAAVKLPLLGDFNISNALAAAAIGGVFGLDASDLAAALTSAPPVPGRLEVLSHEPLVIRDYAHSPAALRSVLATTRKLADGRLIVVFGCGGERDRGKRPLMGQAAAEGADYSIVTSDNPRRENSAAIIAEILPGMGDADLETIEDRRAAIARALQMAGKDDLVLLAGKGHETYQIVGDEKLPFDEAVIVAELSGGRNSA